MATITGLKGGTTNITLTYAGKSTTISNFTVNKLSNQITVNPTSATIYTRAGYNNTISITLGNVKGITNVTVSSYTGGGNGITISGSGSSYSIAAGSTAGTAVVHFTDAGNAQYASSSVNLNLTIADDYITSYSKPTVPTIGQKANFPCSGVTLSTSNIETYFQHSTSIQTAYYASGYSTTVNVTNYTWTVTSGSVASWGNTLSDSTRNVSINIKVTANGAGGSSNKTDSAATTTATQASNPISAYGAITASASQKANFPACGVTLSTSNIDTYYNYSASQAVTLCSGGSTSISLRVSYTDWTITSGSIPSLSGSETNAVTSRTINLTFSVTSQGKTGSKSITTGNQEANTVQSYGALSGSISTSQTSYYTRSGGTLQASQMSSYFSASGVSQTVTLKCGTRAGTVSYSWSGSNVTIPSLCNSEVNSYTTRTVSFTVTATGEGSGTATKTANVTSIQQEKNVITGYGEVTGGTASQKANFPCGGLTLSTSNVETYYQKGGTPAQTITLQCGTRAGSVSWGAWSASGTIPSLSGTETNSVTARTVSVSISANGEGSKKQTFNFTSGNQEANTIQSYGNVTVSSSQKAYFPRAGVTVTTSNIETYFNKSASQTVTLKCGTRAGAITWGGWSGSNVAIPDLNNTLVTSYTSRTINFSNTATGEGTNKSATLTITTGQQEKNEISSCGEVTASATQKSGTYYTRAGGTLQASQISSYFNVSASQAVTLQRGSTSTSTTITWGSWSGSNVTIPDLSGSQQDNYPSRTISFTIRATGCGSKYKDVTITSILQEKNQVSSYGDVTASISQTAYLPRGGVSLTTSNIGTYFTKGTASQTVTLQRGTRAGTVTWGNWSGTTVSIPSLCNSEVNSYTSRTISFSATASGEGSKSKTVSITSANQEKNQISSYGNVTVSSSQKAYFPRAGVTVTTSNIETYFNKSASQTVNLQCGTRAGTITWGGWSGSSVTIPDLNNTLVTSYTSRTINFSNTATGEGTNKTKTLTITTGQQEKNEISSCGEVTASATQKSGTYYTRAGGTLQASQISSYFNVSASQAVTLQRGSTTTSTTISWGSWSGSNVTIPDLSGSQQDNYPSRTISFTIRATGCGGKYKDVTITAILQEKNQVSSYGDVTASVSQKAYFPCGGVTLSTSNVETYYQKGSTSQTVTLQRGTRAGTVTWGSWTASGTIPSLSGTQKDTVTSRTVSVSITATGEGSKSKTVSITSGNQETNPVQSYGNVTASTSQSTQFPCGGVTLSTSNIASYFNKSASQTVTLKCGTRAGTITWGNWSGSSYTVPSLSGTQKDTVTSRSGFSFSITASGEGSKTATATATSGNQETNPVQSYGALSGSISTSQTSYYTRSGGTLQASQMSSYFSASGVSQTVTLKCGTRAGSVTYSWSGNNVSIPSLCNTESNSYTTRTVSFTVTASGEGSVTAKTANVTSIQQEKNVITAYGEVTGGTASQKANFPCGGVTLSTSNVETYYQKGGTPAQTITLQCGTRAGSVSWGAWSASGTIPSLSGTQKDTVTSRTVSVSISANGEGSKKQTFSFTSGNQEANPVQSYGNVTASTSQKSGTYFTRAGGTLSTSNIATYFDKSASQTVTLKCGTRAGVITWGNWSGSSITIPDLNNTRVTSYPSRTISFSITATGEGSKSATATATAILQEKNEVTTYGDVTASVSQSKEFPCGGVTLTSSNMDTYYGTKSKSQTLTLQRGTCAGTVSWGSWTVTTGSIPSLSGSETSSATPRTISATITATGEGSKSKTVTLTSGNQEANTVQSYGDVTASVSQKAYFPCGGVTLSTSNVETYYQKGTPSQTITLKCGTRAGSVSWGAWSASGTIPSLSGTQKDTVTSRTVSVSITATGEGSKSKTVSITSGNQETNPVQSYGDVTVSSSQKAYFSREGVTVTTSNIETYFNKSASQTVTLKCGTRAGAITWGGWSGSNVSIPSLCNSEVNNYTPRTISFSNTATGEGSKSKTLTISSGSQEKNQISSYGDVTASVSQSTQFPCGGVTLTSSNMDTYYGTKSKSQTITLQCGTRAGSVSWGSWTVTTGSIPSLSGSETSSATPRTISATITATGEGSKSKTVSITSGNQEANPIQSYGDVSASVSQGTQFPCAGVTLTTSNIGNYFTKGTPTQTITLKCGTRAGSVSWGNWSGSNVSIPSLSGTQKDSATSRTISFSITATGEGSKSKTVTLSSGNQEANPVQSYGNVTATVSQGTQFPCGGVTLTTSNIETYFTKGTPSQTVTLKCGTRAGTVSWGNWSGSNVSIPSLSGTQTNSATSRTISFSITATGEGSKSKTVSLTSGNQEANTVQSYGDVTASVSQTSYLPRAGVTLSTSNIETYFTKGTPSQTVTLKCGTRAGTVSWGNWSGSNVSIPSLSGTQKDNYTSRTISFSITASGEGSKSKTVTLSSASQEKNQISSYGNVSASTSQSTQFPCAGVTLTTSNIGSYFNKSASQTVTLQLGTRAGSISWGNWSGSSYTVPSLSGTQKDSVTARSGFSFSITATGEGSKSATATATSGNQETNPVQSYGALSGSISTSQKSYYTRAGGTLQASQMSTYFTASGVSQTVTLKCGTRVGSVSYSWSGSNVTIPDLSGTQKDDYTARTVSFTVTASGEGSVTSKTASVTSILQEKNQISSYGDVTASVSQKANFPCSGVTLSTSNVETYYQKGSISQTVTLQRGTRAGSVSWGSWSASGTVPSLSGTETNSVTARTVSVSITATGEGSKSKTVSITSGNQEANPIQSYGNVSASTSQSTQFPCAGVTLSTSNIASYFNKSASQTVTLKCGTRAGSITWGNWSGSSYTVPSLSGTQKDSVTARSGFSFSITATGEGSKSATATATSGNQEANPIQSYGNVSAPAVTQSANFPAGGVTLTTSNVGSYFTRSTNSSQTITLKCGTRSGSISYSWTITSGSVASLGTTLSNAASRTINITYIATGEGSKSNSVNVTSGTQSANYVTSITAKSDTNTDGTHFSYGNIGPGSQSASPSLSGGALYTFSSGSTAFNASGSPSFGGSATYTRQYTLGTVQNGFTAVNSSSGVLTATHRGTTPGAARTSGTVTGTLVVKYTHPSTYSGGGTVTSNTKTSTATCTQGANALEGITFTVGSKTISYQGTTKGTVTARYTSGSEKDVENSTNTSYTDAANPDIVTFTKTS